MLITHWAIKRNLNCQAVQHAPSVCLFLCVFVTHAHFFTHTHTAELACDQFLQQIGYDRECVCASVAATQYICMCKLVCVTVPLRGCHLELTCFWSVSSEAQLNISCNPLISLSLHLHTSSPRTWTLCSCSCPLPRLVPAPATGQSSSSCYFSSSFSFLVVIF